ncbi:protein FAM214A-like [Megalops cyprinoides]|uniref:protein FAM214A-like n=1 Tax=Megalops cyprinoides TaxID=118141 RepID=UPI001863A3CD|nr:protein FAM214A-like [Megalops cyprinoides]
MKPDREAAEEYFEYDAEEFLVLLTLLITEGRTPECSVKGRAEGLHCPPTQCAQPVQPRHECSEKLPQCRQARRMRSEVMLLWRNSIPVMIEVMLLPDCCYSDEGPTTDGNDINDPAIKQDALLLERWTLQPVPRQSGDRLIEEKTLLLAVRSYVFFSQLSAWLSASHGIIPRNILYRISAADEDLVWNFSQPPAEHAFPVPNVSHCVALKVHVQSLPRQPNYPVLKCSIHTSLTFCAKKGYEQEEGPAQCRDINDNNQLRLRDSTPFTNPAHPPAPYSVVSSKKCQLPEVLPPGKAARWLYSRLSSSPDGRPLEVYGTSGGSAEGLKTPTPDVSARALKSLSLMDQQVSPSPAPRLPLVPLGETSPLIGSLLQERQEVIARIAQHLNYCDPTAPHIPDSLFGAPDALGTKSHWFSREEEGLFRRSKEPRCPSPSQTSVQDGTPLESGNEGKSRPSDSDTPLGLCSRAKADSEVRLSPKPTACRKLLLQEPEEHSRISEAVQDISRLIQDTLQQSQSRCSGLLQGTYKTCKEGGTLRASSKTDGEPCSQAVQPQKDASDAVVTNGNESHICTDLRISGIKASDPSPQDCSPRPLTGASAKLEDQTATPGLKTPSSLQNAKKDTCGSSCVERTVERRDDCQGESDVKITSTSLLSKVSHSKAQSQPGTEYSHQPGTQYNCHQDENQTPSTCLTPTSLPKRESSQECRARNEPALKDNVLRTNSQSPLKPCNIWKRQNRHSIDATSTKAFHPCTGLPLLSSPVPQRRTQTGYFDLDTSLTRSKRAPWAASRRVCLNREDDIDESGQQLFSTSAPPASLSLLGNFEECVLNYRLEPLGTVEGFMAEVGASGTFCPSHMTLPVDVSFYSVSDDNAPSPYMGVINLESLGKRGYRIPPSGTIQVTLFNPNKTVVKMFVVVYDLREMPASHQTFLRQRTFSVPVKRETNGNNNRKPLPLRQERTLRYLIHLRFQSSKSGKIYLHRDIRLLFSRKSMEVDSGAAYELKSFTESPANPPFCPRC